MLFKEKKTVKNIKRYLTILLLIAVFAISATGCAEKNISGANATSGTEPLETDKMTRVYDSVGINIPADDVWKKYFNDLDDDGGVMLFEDKIINGYLYFYFSPKEDVMQKKNLFLIAICSKERSLDETKVADLMMFNHAEKLDGNDELDYFFCWNDRDTNGLSEANKDKYNQLYDDMPNMRKLIQFSKPDPQTLNDYFSDEVDNSELDAATKDQLKDTKKISFTAKDINGADISSDIFKESKLTMINVWATFCGPCIAEMPDLQELSEELKDMDVSVLGIVGDTVDENFKEDQNNIELAKNILESKGVEFPNVITNEDLAKTLPVAAYPTTLFVDSEGNVLDEMFVGEKDKEEYKQIISDLLEQINK